MQRSSTELRHMKKIIPGMATLGLFIAACSQPGEQFTVRGTVTGAADSTLILEAMPLNGPQSVSEVTLDKSGAFELHGPRPEAPEFYRLRIGRQFINLSIDSTETVTLQIDYPRMNTAYSVEGSENCENIRQMTLMQIGLQQRIDSIGRQTHLSFGEQSRLVDELVSKYKRTVKSKFIIPDPAATSAYYALFQQIGQAFLFDFTGNMEDIRFLGAIATAWEQLYPERPRTQHLRNLTLRGMSNTRKPKSIELKIDEGKVHETGIIDIELPDIEGNTRKLSDLKGKVVLLDFTVYAAPGAQERLILLRELYKQYAERGLEIYQVSFDENEHFWATSSRQLPWVCVHEKEPSTSSLISLYQLRSIPTYFLIDRNNDLQARAESIPDLEKAIEELL